MGGVRAGAQTHRRCHPHSPQHPAGLRAGRAAARCRRAAAAADLRHRRRRRDRRGDGRRHRRDRAADPGQGFPAHRSALGAHRAAGGRAPNPADAVAGAVGLCRARADPHGRRGQDIDAGDGVRPRRRRSRRRTDRRRHGDLGRRRAGVAGRALARRRGRPRRPCHGRPGPVAARPPGDIRHRRHGVGQRRSRDAKRRASHRRPSRWAVMSAS